MKITIFGLGYVGTVSAGILADLGNEVIGVDINPVKVNRINSGFSPIVEEGIQELIEAVVKRGFLKATREPGEALLDSHIAIVCVGTPNEDDGKYSLDAIVDTSRIIGEHLKYMSPYPTIVIRSTLIPGTTEGLIIPHIEEASGCKNGIDFGVCFNPEFLREGSSIYDFHYPPYTIIGTRDQQAYKIASSIYQSINAPIYMTEFKVAEMIKMVSNAYHGVKVAYANEIGKICKSYQIDSHQVMDLFCEDKKLNISSAYLKPGYAFGGSCLPKDIKALLNMGRKSNLELPLLSSVLPSNNLQIEAAYEMIVKTGKKRIGFLGFSFKEGTDDLRDSPQVELIERLIGKGYYLSLFDPNVSIARLQGANKVYIEKEIPHISSLMRKTIEEVLQESEVIVIGNKDKGYTKIFEKLSPPQVVIDLVRISKSVSTLDGKYQGLSW
jgi:GDP-mannose 6-dehydrogenase